MRNMSFMLTTQQIMDESKTVTRRLGWHFLKPGDIVMACEKCQGLKKGEKINKLKPIRITRVYKDFLYNISQADCTKEGFPEMHPQDFIKMFCKEMKVNYKCEVNRIEFEYIKPQNKE